MAERAAEANRAKNEFVRMIGHEIRNPLSGILATTDLLLDQRLTPEQRDYLFMLRSAAESLVTVTDDVLDLSILEGGSLTIASAEFDFPAVAADVAKMFGPVARNKGLELTVKYDAGMPRLFRRPDLHQPNSVSAIRPNGGGSLETRGERHRKRHSARKDS